jgi:hypothetical protein
VSTNVLWSVLALLLTSVGAIIALLKEKSEKQSKSERNRKIIRAVLLVLIVLGFMIGVHQAYRTDSDSRASDEKHRTERGIDAQRIAGLNQAIETQTKNNEAQYERHQQELHRLQDLLNELKTDVATQELRKRMATLQSQLDKELAPKPRAKLDFTFWQPGMAEREVLTSVYAPVDDNVVRLSFSIVNNSNVSATDVAAWIHICDLCKFHTEPELSMRVPGAPDYERLYRGISLPPLVQWQKLTVEVEVPPKFGSMLVFGKYRCESCEIETNWQQLFVTLGRLPDRAFTTPGSQVKKPQKPHKP